MGDTPAKNPTYFSAYMREQLTKETIQRLSDAEFAAFVRVFVACWYNDPPCSFADDDVVLAKVAQVSLADWRLMKSKVMADFVVEGGRFTHIDLLDSHDRSMRAMRGRSAGGKARHNKQAELQLSFSSASAQHKLSTSSALSPLLSSPLASSSSGKGSAEGKPEEAIIATQSDSFAPTYVAPPLTHSNGTAGHPGDPQGNLEPVPAEDPGRSPLPWTVTSAGIAYDAGEAAYQLYKRKQVAPRNARMAFGRAADRAAEAKKLSPVLALVWMYGRVKAWTESRAYRTTEHQFLKQLDTWLDGDGWDEPEESWARDMREPAAKPASKVIDAADVSRAIAEAQARHDSIHKPRRRA